MLKLKSISNEVAQLAYLLIKEAGICVRCQHEWAKPKHVLCQKCLEYWRSRA